MTDTISCTEWTTFPAQRESYPDMLSFIMEGLEVANLPKKSKLRVELSFEEAIINIIDYAYDTPNEVLLIKYAVYEDGFIIEIADYGMPFDPFNAKERDDSVLALRSIEKANLGGLGIPFIKKSIPNAYYKRDIVNGVEANHLVLPY